MQLRSIRYRGKKVKVWKKRFNGNLLLRHHMIILGYSYHRVCYFRLPEPLHVISGYQCYTVTSITVYISWTTGKGRVAVRNCGPPDKTLPWYILPTEGVLCSKFCRLSSPNLFWSPYKVLAPQNLTGYPCKWLLFKLGCSQ